MKYAMTQQRKLPQGFTLVELLIVISIITIITAIALPTVRDQLRDEKAKRTASLVQSYIDTARARAVNTGKPYGVIIKRSGTSGFESCRSIELRYCRLASSYSGDEPDAVANVTSPDPDDGVTRLVSFPVTNNNGDTIYGNAVIRTPPAGFVVPGDIISFDVAAQEFQVQQSNFNPSDVSQLQSLKVATIDRSEPAVIASTLSGSTVATAYSVSRFRETSSLPLNLMRGTMIDLVFSGYGRGDASFKAYGSPFARHQRLPACQFSPMEIEHAWDLEEGETSTDAYDASSPVFGTARGYDYGDIWIMFAPNGTVYSVMHSELATSGGTTLSRMQHHLVNSNIYLLVGREGKTLPVDPLSLTSKEQATAFDLQSVWVVINGISGEVTTETPNPITDTRDSVLLDFEKTPAEMHNGITKLMHVSREKI